MMETNRYLNHDKEILIKRYEELRSQVLANGILYYDEGAKNNGCVLFLRHGMAGWLKAWSLCKELEPASPYRIQTGTNKGEVVWRSLVYSRAIQILHNVRYAGAYFYGKMKSWKLPDGRIKYKTLPQDKWHTFIKNAHEGYISWEEYEENQRRIFVNASAYGSVQEEKSSPGRSCIASRYHIVWCMRKKNDSSLLYQV